jgi:hypothetical protein
MNQTSTTQPVAPAEPDAANRSVESANLASKDILEPAAAITRAPGEIPEWGDDRYYARHWGINE